MLVRLNEVLAIIDSVKGDAHAMAELAQKVKNLEIMTREVTVPMSGLEFNMGVFGKISF